MEGPEKILALAFLGTLGACVGSFLNVVAYRLPRECMSVRRPRSRCPRCATPIPWFRNVPVLSYLLQRGRAACCRTLIHPRYLLVELLCAGLFVLTAAVILPPDAYPYPLSHGASWLTVSVACPIVAVLLVLSLIDLDYRILPDELTKSGIVLGPVLACLAPELQPTPVVDGWFPGWSPRLVAAMHGVMGGICGMACLWFIGWIGAKAFKKPAMGLGDVKMLGAMGGVLGFWVFLALAVAAVGGSVVGIAVRLIARTRYIPFGPFLAVGMFAVMLWGEDIIRSYVSLFR